MSTLRTIGITGTSSGLGRATVERFAAAGWRVAATVRRPEHLTTFADNAAVHTYLLDVTDPAAIDAVGRQILSELGPVDVLVNNAGYYQMGPLESSTMEQIRAQFETNVFGLIAVTKAFLPHFRQRRAGTIINISSISAENGYPFTAAYGASKAAVATLTDSLNVELAGLGIIVKAIYPGTHATKIFTKVDISPDIPADYLPLIRRFTDAQASLGGSPPEVVADAILRAVTDGRNDKTRYFAGPDATSIPRTKRLLGTDRYFATVKKAILEGPGPIARRLARTGHTPVETDLSKLG